jgi:hypothetical protein
MVETRARRPTRLLWSAVVLGLLLTLLAVILSLISVSIIPRGEGPHSTALVGGGDAETGGVTLRVGDYTISAGDPQYAGTPTQTAKTVCRDTDDGISGGKITQNLLPVNVVPTGFSKCMAEGERLKSTMDA